MRVITKGQDIINRRRERRSQIYAYLIGVAIGILLISILKAD